jgi:hypothetical protein
VAIVVVVSAVVTGVAGLAAVAPSASAAGPRVLRAPYLTDASASSMLVNLATDTASPAPIVTYGPAGGACDAATVTATGKSIVIGSTTAYQWGARIVGLQRDTAYCYRVFQATVDLLSGTRPTFRTAAPPGGAFSFAVIGDWGAGGVHEANVFTQIAASRPNFLVTVGDNAYNDGSQSDYGDVDGGNVFTPAYWGQIGATTPGFPAFGNHGFSNYNVHLDDWPMDSVVASSGGRFGPNTYCCLSQMAGSKTYSDGWYAFDWGSARFYVLQAAWSDGTGGYQSDFEGHWSNGMAGCGPCGAEMQWLKDDLAAHASTPMKFAFFHYPLYSDNSHETSDDYLNGADALEGVLAGAGVNIVFNGHAHFYERNKPMIAGSPMVSYVTGGGGGAPEPVDTCSAFDAFAIGSSSRKCPSGNTTNASVYHFLKVDVDGSGITVTPIDENGTHFDVQHYPVSGSPPPPPTSTTTTTTAPTTTTTKPPPPPPTGTVSGWTLDGWGGLHPFGAAASATTLAGTPYWPGWDIARGVAFDTNGWGVEVDGWGGLHTFSARTGASIPAVTSSAYWRSWDIVRGVALMPDDSGGFVVDGWGGLHAFGIGTKSPPTVRGGPYWPGWDIARGVTIDPSGTFGYVLDGWGGLHPFTIGSTTTRPKTITGSAYWPGWDIARGVAIASDGTSGATLDGWGGLHTFAVGTGKPPTVSGAAYWPGWDIARGVALR